tara:strand:+ start:684 stop:959 length:276 start_codon:yes stop_codon:yes gene_type:complete
MLITGDLLHKVIETTYLALEKELKEVVKEINDLNEDDFESEEKFNQKLFELREKYTIAGGATIAIGRLGQTILKDLVELNQSILDNDSKNE